MSIEGRQPALLGFFHRSVCSGSDPVLRDSRRFFHPSDLLCSAQTAAFGQSGHKGEAIMKLLKNILAFAFIAVIPTTASAQETRPSGPSKPTQSEFFTSHVAMVLVAQQEPTAIFALTLAAKKPLPSGSTIQVEFENPNRPDEPFIIAVVGAQNGKVVAQSPRFEGIRNKTAYLTRTRVFGADQHLLSIHDQWIWFEMPKAMRGVYATKIFE
jgi:hypothetical protein